jgi:hypothetical protein
MDSRNFFKQALAFNKSTFDNAFNAVAAMQEQTVSMVGNLARQSPWLTEDGKKAIKQWEQPFRKGRDDFKAAVDENFKKAEDMFSKS